MIIITVARKPLDGNVLQTVLKWRTGAINIDACRIGERNTTTINNVTDKDGETKPMTFGSEHGGFPSNLILSHLSGCVKSGVVLMESSGHYPATRGPGRISTSGHKGQTGLIEIKSKKDVEIWECQHGCPVAAIDAQYGVKTSGTAVQRNNDSGVHNNVFGARKKLPIADVGFKDKGGASRFFKQVQNEP